MATATEDSVAHGPLSSDDQKALGEAHRRAARIRSAARVASFNGWTIGVFAALTLPLAGSSISGILIAAAMALAAYNEFRGRTLLLDFDPRGPRLLGWNQLGLLGALTLYCAWHILQVPFQPDVVTRQLSAHPEIATLVGSTDELVKLYHLVLLAVYTTVILLSVLFQGGNAWYYFSRGKLLDAHLDITPAWIVEVQRTMR